MTRRRIAGLTLPALSIVGFIALWQLVVELRGIPPIYLPAPTLSLTATSISMFPAVQYLKTAPALEWLSVPPSPASSAVTRSETMWP